MTWLLSLIPIGGLGLACVFIPGFATRLIEIAGQVVGLIARYPWQAALALALGFAGWCWHGWNGAEAERAVLAKWQDDVTEAARNAAHRPRLGKAHVAQQVTNLGASLDAVVAAQEAARQRAIEAKAAQERDQERKRKGADDALSNDIAAQRRRSAAALAARGLHGIAGGPPEAGSGAGGSDLPDPAFGTEEPDSTDRGSEPVLVSLRYIDACDAVTARLRNAQDWWQQIRPEDFKDGPTVPEPGFGERP
jgi:hypothetical protein